MSILGDITNKYDLAWLDLELDAVEEYLRTSDGYNPFDDKLQVELENKGLREIFLMYDPNYLWYTVKLLLNIELHPIQAVVLGQMMTHSFPMLIGSRGFSKSFLMAVYSLIRAILFPGSKIVITGAAFRQSKFVFEYVENMFYNSPILQSIYKGTRQSARLPDFWTFHLNESKIFALPTGTGEKIRGMRGNIIICDEFNSISTEVYEIVISQFAAVSSSPIENIKAIAKKLAQQKDGIVEEEHKALSFVQNQSIISGTMKYQFEPMAIYWQKYKAIIESRGERMVELFGELGDSLDWRDFCIIRIPFELIPKGFMDDKIVARARSTMHSEFYAAEYGCVPISDSMGFFKRSLIESCTAKLENTTKDNWPTWCASPFDCKLQGNPNAKYVMGIDPAYNQDNFAIVILEVLEEHSRIVYAWSTSKRTFNKSGPVDEKNYFNFCARKIRDLMKSFNIVGIAIDTQGGGYSILECLHDPDKMQSGELPLWPVIDPDKPQDTDDYAGSHIITLCQFSSADWVSTNNHGMKKDMEDKVLLFPQFNSILLGLASEKDKEELLALGLVRDSLEDCMVEIEELKDELCLIVRTTTVAGRERFDTPSIIVGSNKKEQLRKDRYSALLIANSIARTIQRSPAPISYQVVGAAKGTTNKSEGKMYFGPDWVSNINSKSFRGITRR